MEWCGGDGGDMGYGSEGVRVLFCSFLSVTPSTAPSLSPFTVEKDHICWKVLVLSYVVIYSYNNSTLVYSVHTSMSDCSPELPPGSYSAGIVGNTSVVGTRVEIPGKWWIHGWRYLISGGYMGGDTW